MLLMASILMPEHARGQRPNVLKASDGHTTLPVIPDLEPRPAADAAANQQLRTLRTGDERAPIAAFLDSLKGNDAAIEVVVHQSKLLTTKEPISREEGVAVVAVADPTVIDFDVLPDQRMIRLLGRRVGVTDLMVVTADGQTHSFEVHVVYDLNLLRAQLQQFFPDAYIKLGQIREHLVVEGQARSDAQVRQILETLRHYLASIQTERRETRREGDRPEDGGAGNEGGQQAPAGQDEPFSEPPPYPNDSEVEPLGDPPPAPVSPFPGVAPASQPDNEPTSTEAAFVRGEIINLLRVPGVHQVMLKVRIAELNRSALREIGTDLSLGSPGNTFLQSLAANGAGNLIGIFPNADFDILLRAFRENNVATILAEPNLVALSGHVAQFLSGGEFPVPVAQQGGGAGNNTVEFRPFGVQLSFVPYIQDDGVIRLTVRPEVSTVADDLSVTLIAGGDPVPGLRSRTASTTVELRQGQTLAIAGLLNNEIDASTRRVPLLGDLPYIGPLFSLTRHEVVEQELLVTVTPYLVSPVNADETSPLPGEEITEPNDLELYLLNRIEGRTGWRHRATTHWDNPFHRESDMQMQMQLEQRYLWGPVGHSE